jgi:hypothetical protein
MTVASLPHHVATMRLFVSAVARVAGLDVETTDDAKLAVSELVTAIVEAGDSEYVTLVATPMDGSLHLVLGPWREGLGENEEFSALDIAVALFAGTSAEGEFVTLPIVPSDADG